MPEGNEERGLGQSRPATNNPHLRSARPCLALVGRAAALLLLILALIAKVPLPTAAQEAATTSAGRSIAGLTVGGGTGCVLHRDGVVTCWDGDDQDNRPHDVRGIGGRASAVSAYGDVIAVSSPPAPLRKREV